MRKSFKYMFLLFASVLFMSIMACEEKSPKEKIKDGMEEVGEGIKDAGEDVKDKVDEAVEEVKDEGKEVKDKVDEDVEGVKNEIDNNTDD